MLYLYIILTVCGLSQKAVATAASLLLRKTFSQTTRYLKSLENGLDIFLLCWISTPLNRIELLHINQPRSHDRYMRSRVRYICIFGIWQPFRNWLFPFFHDIYALWPIDCNLKPALDKVVAHLGRKYLSSHGNSFPITSKWLLLLQNKITVTLRNTRNILVTKHFSQQQWRRNNKCKKERKGQWNL